MMDLNPCSTSTDLSTQKILSVSPKSGGCAGNPTQVVLSYLPLLYIALHECGGGAQTRHLSALIGGRHSQSVQ